MLEKYTVSSHTNGVFKKENQLNDISLNEYKLISHSLKSQAKEIKRRLHNLYNINQFDAEATLKALISELDSIIE